MDDDFNAIDIATADHRDCGRVGYWGSVEDWCEDREAATPATWEDLGDGKDVRPDPIAGLKWRWGACSVYLREHLRLSPTFIARVTERSLLDTLRDMQFARELLDGESVTVTPSPPSRERPRIRIFGPDGSSARLDPQDGEFWRWSFYYTEDSRSRSRISGLHLKWLVGIFATDAHVGGLILAQYGRGIGRHPGHAGREIGDAADPREGTARHILRTQFRMEVEHGSRSIDSDGEGGDFD